MFKLTGHDELGREVVDPRPVALPAGWDRPESLNDQIRRLVRQQLSAEAVSQGMESFEEADDFDVADEEGDFVSPYEIVAMSDEVPAGALPDAPGGGSDPPPVPAAPGASSQAPAASAAPAPASAAGS